MSRWTKQRKRHRKAQEAQREQFAENGRKFTAFVNTILTARGVTDSERAEFWSHVKGAKP